jgi:hypothetical protein
MTVLRPPADRVATTSGPDTELPVVNGGFRQFGAHGWNQDSLRTAAQ